ncbi:PD40 domain-containing protein [Bradyrhizobium lablabi]|uniref:VCBS repeat-containing protein n=1 Tax=Bradyrhizobium lablabi TaxID=722472 RepID=UPI001BA9BB40|nr:FG-GAP-like repeat-containing protein [Bradyrhizobium lablabi]MBR1123356.1 PD40 domain-containing protein [Bradyrhizobium lablabi]
MFIGAFKSTYAITRVSTSAAGAQGNSDSFNPVFSPDGSKIAFNSMATNLVADDTNFFNADIFVKDLATGAITRISVGADGTQANGSSSSFVFSPDGGKIAFQSDASNLVAGDTTGFTDIFVKDLATGAITLVSRSAAGAQGDYTSYNPVFSPDGSKIAFESEASNLITGDTNHSGDIFVKDLATGEVTRVSVSDSGDQSHFESSNPVFSPDGSKIAFVSRALELAGGVFNGNTDIFVKDLATGAISRVSVDAAGTAANSWSNAPVFSPDGSKIAFYSEASNLVAGDTNNDGDFFIKDLATGAITRISVDAAGAQANQGGVGKLAFSPDGSKVAFVSGSSNLITGDTNSAEDVFVKDLTTGAITRVSVDAAGAQGNSFTFDRAVFSPDGSRIAFSSHASNFVAGDTNSDNDIFIKNLTPDPEDPAIYRGNAAPVRVNTAPVTISDVDNSALPGGSLTAALTAGNHAGDALTLIASQTPGTGIEVSGSTVKYNGTAIGTLSGSGTASLSVTLNASADVAAVEALAGAVSFSALGSAPSTDTRTVTFTLVDGPSGTDTGSFTQAVQVTSAPQVHNDFDGDGKSDIVWRNDAGVGQIWDMDGATILETNSLGTVPTNWKVAGIGDFNADGNTDLLWRNDAGVTQIWKMDDSAFANTHNLGVIPAVWKLASTGDFNGDGTTDLLWRHDNGTVQMWDMNNGAIADTHNLGMIPTAWKLAGTGDFNGDGKTDLLWRNDSGVAQIWDMDGGNILSATSLGSIPTTWNVAGIGDFNGDSKSDILWRNDSGITQIWNMNDGAIASTRGLGLIPNDWKVGSVGDYNGDLKSDILWRNDSGLAQMWEMNDGTITQATSLGMIPDNWHVIA